ncbi:MAG TPA: hypothetical protein VKX16_06745 [Chloroflexota bacterium]|nr:hypothetical protein [Chloroflexota bacterium]
MLRLLTIPLGAIFLLLTGVLPAAPAPPAAISLLGNLYFTSAHQGWIEISSSAYYTVGCQSALRAPPACAGGTTGIFSTADGGKTWTERLRVTGAPLVAPHLLPDAWMHAFSSQAILVLPFTDAYNSPARLYRSFDGGRTWQSARIPGPPGFSGPTDLAFAGHRRLWLILHYGAAAGSEQVSLFRTRNAGVHWSRIACIPVQGAQLRCPAPSGLGFGGFKGNIVFANATHGWLTHYDYSGIPSLFVTNDGGYHWTVTRPGLPRGVSGPSPRTGTYPDAQYEQPIPFGHFVVLPTDVNVCTTHPRRNTTCRGTLYALLSFDDGNHWTASRRIPAGANTVRPIWQAMTSHIWWSVDGSRLWATHDAGMHWRPMPLRLPKGQQLFQIQFLSPSVGWAIAGQTSSQSGYARSTTLLRTANGGRSWAVVPLHGVAP